MSEHAEAEQEYGWNQISTAPEGKAILTKIDDARGVRNIRPLKRHGNLWFFTDGSMNVYYTPTHWKEIGRG